MSLIIWIVLWAAFSQAVHAADPPAKRRAARVKVDPRVELLSIIFRLAENQEYSRGRVRSYAGDVDKHFGPFREHPVVELARRLRRTRGVSYDACMSMAVHLTDAYTLGERVPFDPRPEGLDGRWPLDGAREFVEDARQFVEASSFKQFVDDHQALYKTAVSRMAALLDKDSHLEWFDAFFGPRPQARFTVALGLLNGGACYGPHCRMPDGSEELYCILGVWKTDDEGLPEFDRSMLDTVVHEFCHSYANPIIDRHADELQAAGEKIFPTVAAAMKRQAYGNWKTMMYESLVRVSTIRYVSRYNGPDAARQAIAANELRGFRWIGELSELLAEYEAERDRYPTLEAFAPRIVDFFNRYAEKVAKEQEGLVPGLKAMLGEYARKVLEEQALAARRPRIVSTTPADGAKGVAPGAAVLEVIFDRPMGEGSWSLVGGGPNFPELAGQPSYDADHKVWSVPVQLKPDWDYQFKLNSDRSQSFRSREGVPLAPVTVRFTTGK